jgi:hypothetical protein
LCIAAALNCCNAPATGVVQPYLNDDCIFVAVHAALALLQAHLDMRVLRKADFTLLASVAAPVAGTDEAI